MKHYRVVITYQAKQSLKEIIQYIKAESPPAAVYVRKTLLLLIRSLGDFPDKFSKEPFLSHKKKNYRSVTKWHYKIIYDFTGKEVIVLDIIHTSRNPKVISQVKSQKR